MAVLNPVARVTVTFLLIVLNPTVEIPTPLEFLVGITVGGASWIPNVFLKISTLGLPNLYFKSRSKTGLFVNPSITTNSGEEI